MKVERGQLVIVDGFANEGGKQIRILSRGKCDVERVVIIGHTGTMTLDAISWLMDMEIEVFIINSDGELVTQFGKPHRPTVELRQNQVKAAVEPFGIEFSRWLLGKKLSGQLRELATLQGLSVHVENNSATALIQQSIRQLQSAKSIDELRLIEARAAHAYWKVWEGIQLKWPEWAAKRVPAHWHFIQSRNSGKTGTNRHATDPVNAMLNYGYTVLEAETKIAAYAEGFDVDFGILHVSTEYRTSFVYDLMEPLRPIVDRWILNFISTHSFRPNELHESREGICRLDPDLAEELSTGLGKVLRSECSTLAREARIELTRRVEQSNRVQKSIHSQGKRRMSPVSEQTCQQCRTSIVSRTPRKFCGRPCYQAWWKDHVQERMQNKAVARLTELRESGNDPTHGGEAARKRGEKIARSNRLNPRKYKVDEN